MGAVYRTRDRKPTKFSPFVDEYFVNAKGRLELKPIQRNQQDFIDSQVYTKLDDIYDAFTKIPANYQFDELVKEVVRYETDLDLLLEADSVIDDYIREMDLPSDVSRSEVYGLIMSRAETARGQLRDTAKEQNQPIADDSMNKPADILNNDNNIEV